MRDGSIQYTQLYYSCVSLKNRPNAYSISRGQLEVKGQSGILENCKF